MSLYEALVFAALLVVSGFAYRLYRKDTAREAEAQEKPAATDTLMFGRDRSKPGIKD